MPAAALFPRTTEEPAIEARGSLKLKYYVRRQKDCYEKVNLNEKLAELGSLHIPQFEDRVTEYGKYDITVNNHW